MMDIHHEVIKEYREYLDFAEFLVEGYCIFNEDAKVYQKTNCTKPTVEDALAYAYMAENFFNLPSFYIEYSGQYEIGRASCRERVEMSVVEVVVMERENSRDR